MGIPTNRYSKITDKHPREICLLRSFPCAWGKCSFCDYIEDNGKDGVLMAQMNRQVLGQVTGEFGVLEVINSGSCFELPRETFEDIDKVIETKDLKQLFFESHWMYRGQVADLRQRMGVPIIFKIGVETFDYDFRQKVLNKHADFKEPCEVAEYFDSPCLMVGIKGQTKEMIAHDIHCLKKYFPLGTINVYNNNTTKIRRDEELVRWFLKEYSWLNEDPAVEVLWEITDFGVG
ncbi:radical SAM protein [Clostridiaceae bacterium]|nr:radical SAM protein [Clostridiaceae bacterium]